MTLPEIRERMGVLKAKRSHAIERLHEEKTAAQIVREHIDHITEAQRILQQVAQSIQQQAHDKIASVVSRCLSAVFQEDAYEFRIHFDRKRGRTEARIVFVRDDHELSPTTSTGGGVLDIASFALRLACLMLRKPAGRRLLVMDEPFRNLHSPLYRQRARQMVETLAEEMDFQFVVSTGIEEFQMGTIIEVDL